MSKIIVKRTNRYGMGVYAGKPIKKGEVIRSMGGRRLDVNEVWREILSGKINIDDPLQIGRRTHIVLDNISRLFNHSCDPNAGLRKNSELFALRDIMPREEITMDYSLTSSPTNNWTMRCKCGTKLCRKTIGDILSVPKSRLEYYKKAGALQTYMRRLLADLQDNPKNIKYYDARAIANATYSLAR
jgi:SET domain-containing protein